MDPNNSRAAILISLMRVARFVLGIYSKVAFLFQCQVLGKTAYLRRAGARIGEGCEVLTAVENFGSEPWLIQIGDRVTVAHGVKLVTHDASTRIFRSSHPQMNVRFGNKFAPIRIASDAFIGIDAIVLPGVSIGERSIVAAGAVVTKDVPADTVVAGVPARLVFRTTDFEAKCALETLSIKATTREQLRRELTLHFWGEPR